jgi:hypothetical protein
MLTEGARKIYRGRHGARGRRVGQGWLIVTSCRDVAVGGPSVSLHVHCTQRNMDINVRRGVPPCSGSVSMVTVLLPIPLFGSFFKS